MSLQTWKDEFYPIEADKCRKKDALAHSLRKWTGLTKTNLKKHGCEVDCLGNVYCVDVELVIGDRSCALCEHYSMGLNDCIDCPLYKTRGVDCDSSTSDSTSPYGEWVGYQNVRPMLNLLRKAMKEEENEPDRKKNRVV